MLISLALICFVCSAFAAPIGMEGLPETAVIPCHWILYKQCNSTYGSNHLGTSGSETICSAGCAMSSVSMILASNSIKIDSKTANPGSLNSWLTSHGGYVDSDLIVWNSVAALGHVSMIEDVPNISRTDLKAYINKCDGVVANVRSGTHWVLVIGYDTADENTFYVNDPGFSVNSYDYTTMINFVAYN
eukprot:TRINITY_DN5358_c0_g1_i1.p1 TRINITY_DN5358_c0_g1~~TRINITY_DN5358_c0_g1_i1.p1  ORF type:complete len:188 (+),score=22.64 TRINITY_DN5358_c0_g1_i1:97-660(+)